MTTTYTGDPSTSSKDAVRFLIGDTVDEEWEVSDEEITWAVTTTGDQYLAAVWCLDALAAKYAGLVDKQVGDLRITYSQRAEAYHKRAQELGDRITTDELVAGALTARTWTDRLTVLSDLDRLPGVFEGLAISDDAFRPFYNWPAYLSPFTAGPFTG